MVVMSEGKHETATMLASKLGGGPHGLGDPADQSLRKVEKNVVIPKMMRSKAKDKCPDEVKAFTECGQNQGLLLPFKCRKENTVMLECIVSWCKRKDFFEECKAEYLRDRTIYRETGVTQQPYKRKPSSPH